MDPVLGRMEGSPEGVPVGAQQVSSELRCLFILFVSTMLGASLDH
jgi:hypothetical protein